MPITLEVSSRMGAADLSRPPPYLAAPLYGGVVTVSPVVPRGIVVAGLLIAQQLQHQHAVPRTDACLSMGQDFAPGSDAVGLK